MSPESNTQTNDGKETDHDTASIRKVIFPSVADEIKSFSFRKNAQVSDSSSNISVSQAAGSGAVQILSGQGSSTGEAPVDGKAITEGPTTDEFAIHGIASAGLDSRTMRVLEARIYSLVKEILDVDSMNVVRRNLVSLIHQSSRLMFSTTLQEWASAQAKVCSISRKYVHTFSDNVCLFL